MCRWLSTQAFDDDGNPWPECPEPIPFDDDNSIQERVGTCTCFITGDKPEEKALMEAFIDQCVRPLMKQVSYGYIRVNVH